MSFSIFNGCHTPSAPSGPALQGQVLLVRTAPHWQDPVKNSGTDIYVENTGYHTTTDSFGTFSIPSLAATNNTIVVSHPGWATKRFYHVLGTPSPQNNPFVTWLYPTEPQNLAVIDSIVLEDTVLTEWSRTGVVIGSNGDTLNQGTLTSTSTHDTNVLVFGHSTVPDSSATVVVYLGLRQPDPSNSTTFFDIQEWPLNLFRWPAGTFVAEFYHGGRYDTNVQPGTLIYADAFASPFAGGLSYSDSLQSPIYSLFTGNPGNVQTFIEP